MLDVSRVAKSGLFKSSRAMVGTPVNVVGRSRSMSSRATSGSQRCIRTSFPPTAVTGCRQQLQPVTWNSGTPSTEPGMASPVCLSDPAGGSPAATALASALACIICQKARFKRLDTAPRWVSTAPLGCPVVPEV